ncbi:Uncharacterized protein RNJ44_02275 [Nakaseomyces bracarensis]|uniref:DNA-binding TFAR19-related protein n=1 Tax=Nakaseomyces bracarensis TaxID=273131 RepID=A0ABR4NN12_9SACH
MDAELQALREARLAELKRGTNGSSDSEKQERVGSSISHFLEPQALERLSRVSLVRPDRAQAVEKYLAQLASTGQLRAKVTEKDIVQILDGIAKEQNKKNDTKIIFNRREVEEDDFFD